MELHVTLTGRGPLGAALYQQLRHAILTGRLRPGEPLPATRELAERLSVSHNTVLGAYQRLGAEGFLTGRAGAGTVVAAPLAGIAAGAPRPRRPAAALAPRPIWRALAAPPPQPPRPMATWDFSVGAPDPALFPWDAWRHLVARQLRGRRPPPGTLDPQGAPRLREAIARHLGRSRGVEAGADEVLVTSGAQQAIDLVARVLVEPGRTVAVEEPGYPPARQAFAALGARVVPVPVDAEGIDVAALPDDAALVYVTPSHQFPLGRPMSLARRLALLAWAERRSAAILEDDYDSELRHDGRSLEPLQRLDRSGRVVYVGTFSKILLPALRLGYAVAPPSLLPALRAARRLADLHGAPERELALAGLMEEGLLARHVRRVQRIYRARREALLAALGARLGDAVEVLPAAAGLHLALFLRGRGPGAAAVAAAAAAAGVAVEPLGPYYAARARPGLALGYGLVASERIDEGVRRLAGVLGR